MTLTAGKARTARGENFDGKGGIFTLFSAHAEPGVELCVFDGEGNEHRYDLPRAPGILARLPAGRWAARDALQFFRVHGPWAPAQGHWFNPAKLLIDPCAHRVEREFKDDPIFHVGYENRPPRQRP